MLTNIEVPFSLLTVEIGEVSKIVEPHNCVFASWQMVKHILWVSVKT